MAFAILQEDGFLLLQEDNFRIEQDAGTVQEGVGLASATSTAAAIGSFGAVFEAAATAAGQSGSYIPLRGMDGELILDVLGQPIFLTEIYPVEWDSSYIPNAVSGAFSSSGTSTASAVGSFPGLQPAVGTAAGTSTVSSVGRVVFNSVARQNTPTATVTGVGTALRPGAFSVAGFATVSGSNSSGTISPTTVTVSGVATANFFSRALNFEYPDVEAAIVPIEPRTAFAFPEPPRRAA